MNQEVALFKSQYILEDISKIDSDVIYNITHDTNNNVASIVWMTPLSIDVMQSSMCNTEN